MHPIVFVLLGALLQLVALILGRMIHPLHGPLIGIIAGFIVFLATIFGGLLIYAN